MEYCLLLNKGKQGTEYISVVCKDASWFTESVVIHDVWNWSALGVVWHESQFSISFKVQSSVWRLCLKHTRRNGGIMLPTQPTADQHLCSHLPVHVTPPCGKTGGDRILPGGFHLRGGSTPFLPPSHVCFLHKRWCNRLLRWLATSFSGQECDPIECLAASSAF